MVNNVKFEELKEEYYQVYLRCGLRGKLSHHVNLLKRAIEDSDAELEEACRRANLAICLGG